MRCAMRLVLASASVVALMVSVPASANDPGQMGGGATPQGGDGLSFGGEGGWMPNPNDVQGVIDAVTGAAAQAGRHFTYDRHGQPRKILFRGPCAAWARAEADARRRGDKRRAYEARQAYQMCLGAY